MNFYYPDKKSHSLKKIMVENNFSHFSDISKSNFFFELIQYSGLPYGNLICNNLFPLGIFNGGKTFILLMNKHFVNRESKSTLLYSGNWQTGVDLNDYRQRASICICLFLGDFFFFI